MNTIELRAKLLSKISKNSNNLKKAVKIKNLDDIRIYTKCLVALVEKLDELEEIENQLTKEFN